MKRVWNPLNYKTTQKNFNFSPLTIGNISFSGFHTDFALTWVSFNQAHIKDPNIKLDNLIQILKVDEGEWKLRSAMKYIKGNYYLPDEDFTGLFLVIHTTSLFKLANRALLVNSLVSSH